MLDTGDITANGARLEQEFAIVLQHRDLADRGHGPKLISPILTLHQVDEAILKVDAQFFQHVKGFHRVLGVKAVV